jgi:hypothetical protein
MSVAIAAAVSAVSILPTTIHPALASMDEPISYKWSANKGRFAQRIKHIQEQIDMGQSKGWLTEEQVAKFKADFAKINEMEQEWQRKGCPQAEEEPVEKQVTAVHHYLHEAINAGYARTASTAPETSQKATQSAKVRSSRSKKTAGGR